MKTVHIMEAIAECIEKKILGEWKHEGYIDGTNSEQVRFIIDGQVYVVSIVAESHIEKLLEPHSKAK